MKARDALAASQLLLWHLEKDFETLKKAIKKNELECAVMVHAVLQNVISDCPESSKQTNSSY